MIISKQNALQSISETYGGELEEQKQRVQEDFVQLSSRVKHGIFESRNIIWQQLRAVLCKRWGRRNC
jgi:hypothetical protein